VKDYDPNKGAPADQADQWEISRLSISYEDSEAGVTFSTLLDRFLAEPAAARAPGLVIGAWDFESMNGPEGSVGVVKALVAARDRLPNLRALFLGDIVFEECEISWINQSDVSPILGAYPALEHFRVRGATGLSLGTLRHDRLKSLVVESGGLFPAVIAEVAAADLPQLGSLAGGSPAEVQAREARAALARMKR
jgi:hypothetical protein